MSLLIRLTASPVGLVAVIVGGTVVCVAFAELARLVLRRPSRRHLSTYRRPCTERNRDDHV